MAATPAPANRVSEKLIVVWGGLVIYLIAFFAAPLSTMAGRSSDVIRRGHLWAPLFLPDEVWQSWTEDASWHALGQRAVILAVAALVLALGVALGWIVVRLSGLDRRLSRGELVVFSSGVGLNLLSLVVLVLGLSGLLYGQAFAALGASVIGVHGFLYWRQLRCPPTDAREQQNSSTGPMTDSSQRAGATDSLQLSHRWLWLTAPFVLVIFASAMLPPVDFDVREYHLQAPKEFFLAGRITFLPHNVYGNMPLATEMLSLLGMVLLGDWWTGALVGKTIIAAFAPLTALALYAVGRRLVSPTVGVLAALLYISIPWVALVSSQGLVEGAFGFYLFTALYAVLLWREQSKTQNLGWATLALAGFLAGAAVCVKYPAVVYCVLPLAAYIAYVSLSERGWTYAAKPLAVFLVAAGLACGPWFVKNLVLTGNPTYPLFSEAFDGRTRTPEKNAQWNRAHAPPNYDAADLARRSFDVLLASDWLSPLVIPLAVLAMFLSPRRRLTFALAAYFAVVVGLWWLFTHRIDRFWVPALPLAALLAGLGAVWNVTDWWRGTLAALLAIGLLYNFVVIASGELVGNNYLADLDVLRRDPDRVDVWHEYINGHADEIDRVLLVGDAQPFDLEVPVEYNTVFDDCIFEQLAQERTPRQVAEALHERGISHIFVDWSEINRYRSPGNYGITDFLQPSVFADLVAAGVLEPVPPIPTYSGRLFRVLAPQGTAAAQPQQD